MKFINFVGANDAFFEEFDAESIEIIELGTVTRADKTTALGQFRNGEYASFEDGKEITKIISKNACTLA